MCAAIRFFRISAADIGPNRLHQSRTVLWLISIPRSARRSSTLRSDSGYLTYIIKTRPTTSAELLKYRNGSLMAQAYYGQSAASIWSDKALAGDRAVEPDPSHRPRAAHGVAEQRRRRLAIDVAGLDPVVTVSRFDHRDGRVLGRRHRERTGQHWQEINAQGPLPRLLSRHIRSDERTSHAGDCR